MIPFVGEKIPFDVPINPLNLDGAVNGVEIWLSKVEKV